MRRILVCLILFLVGFGIYSNTFQAGFYFDDWPVIRENAAIRHPGNLGVLWSAFNTRFIVGLTFAWNYAVGTLNPFGYHLFNIICHILSSLLVALFIHLIFKTPPLKEYPLTRHKGLLAFFASLLFLVHPLQTQAVNYIWQRTACLATFFYLSAVILYAHARRTHRLYAYLGALLTTVLGMFTKEIAFTIPLTLALYEFSFLGPFREGGKRRLLLLTPFLLALGIIPLTLTLSPPAVISLLVHESAHAPLSRPEYFLTQLNVIRTYLRLLFFPMNQNLDYDYTISRTLFDPNTFLSLLLLSAIGLFALKTFKRQRLLFFGICWFFLTLSVESSIVNLSDVIFEHRLYLPMVGFTIFLSTGLFLLLKGPRRFIIVFSLLTLVFSVTTYRRNQVWRDELTLWQDVVRKSPGKARGYNGLGLAYSKAGTYDEAIAAYQKAIKLNPDYAQAHTSLGAAYGKKGDHDQAIAHLRKAIKLNPKSVKAYNNLGAAYGKKGDYRQTIKYCKRALELNPTYADAYNNVGSAYGKRGDYDQAIRYFQEAIALDPGNALAHLSLGFTFHQRGDRAGTLKQVERLRKLNQHDLADQLEKVSQ